MKKFFVVFPLVATIFYGASQALAVTISPAIPGMAVSATSAAPGDFVGGFYKFALMIGGVLAFGAIVYGGFLYASSGGNPSKQTDGKEWITSALLGLLLLAGAYLILYTVNPDITTLKLPTLSSITISAVQGGGGAGATCTDGHSCDSNVCVNGQCQAANTPPQGGGAAGTGCTRDADCASGLTCQWTGGNRVCSKQSN